MGKKKKVIETYTQKYNANPEVVVQSPGRINLLGEHVDYNAGTVLPAAINKYIYLAIGFRDDNEIKIFASDFHDEYSCFLDTLKPAWKLWPNYILGVIDEFRKSGKSVTGLNIVIGGDIPLAAGMSSSAAMGCAAAYAINQLYNWNFSRLELAKIAQRSENDFVGVKCGLMDQFASLFGKDKNLIKLNCDSFEYEYVPFEAESLNFVLFDSGLKHHLISSEYNKRRQECQQGWELIKQKLPHITHFADLQEYELFPIRNSLSTEVYNRCLYVVQELNRVERACEAITLGNFEKLGLLMYLTHEGLRDLYEVSCAECDFLVDFAKKTHGILGARMMGAGFGGCTINLIEKSFTEEAIAEAKASYKNEFGKELKVYDVSIGNGTSFVDVKNIPVKQVYNHSRTDFVQVYPKRKKIS